MKANQIILSLILYLTLDIELVESTVNLKCECQDKATSPKDITEDPSFKIEDVIGSNGTNWGTPVLFAGFYILPSLGIPKPSTQALLGSDCPTGYAITTKDEMETIMDEMSDPYTELTDPDGLFKFDPMKHYYTSTKDPDNPSNAYIINLHYGMSKEVTLEIEALYTTRFGICIFKSDGIDFNITGNEYDLEIGVERTMSVSSNLVKGFLWKFQGKTYDGNTVTISSNERGCEVLEIWAKVMNDDIIYSCNIIYSRTKFNMNGRSNFNLSYVHILTEEYTRTRTREIHFGPSLAPIAPKADGGYYMAYNDITDKKMTIVEYKNTDEIVTTKALEYDAMPMDIIETDYGIGIYAKYVDDPNHAFVLGINTDFSERFCTTIMNNGNTPTADTGEGLIFKDSSGKPLYGLRVMYDPDNGKLSYGRGYLCVVFAHYNYFEDSGGHTGSTYYIFDESGAKETAQFAWNWETSHSLIQSHIYDGRYFVVANLGDAYPKGITLGIVDVMQHTSSYDNENKYKGVKYYVNEDLCGYINGSMTGLSVGRLAGLMQFEDYYVVVYSVKPSTDSNTDGIFMLKFRFENGKITQVGKKITIKSNCASSIVQMRAAKYGKRILITYTENSKPYGVAEYPSRYETKTETMFYMLVTISGKILVNSMAETNHQAIAEDIRELKDGSLRWGYVDTKNILRVVRIDIDDESESPPEEAERVDDNGDDDDKGGLSGGAIAGIVIGVAAVVGVAGFFLYTKILAPKFFNKTPEPEAVQLQ